VTRQDVPHQVQDQGTVTSPSQEAHKNTKVSETGRVSYLTPTYYYLIFRKDLIFKALGDLITRNLIFYDPFSFR
jgi:hypothetical protein